MSGFPIFNQVIVILNRPFNLLQNTSMTVTTLITLSPDDLEALISRAVAPFAEAIKSLEEKVKVRKHVYTVAEVAEQIGYTIPTVQSFIRQGRKARNGDVIRLQAKEPTKGDYRVTPDELDRWLSFF